MTAGRFSMLTGIRVLITCPQVTRQASALRDTLNSGGFFFTWLLELLPSRRD